MKRQATDKNCLAFSYSRIQTNLNENVFSSKLLSRKCKLTVEIREFENNDNNDLLICVDCRAVQKYYFAPNS